MSSLSDPPPASGATEGLKSVGTDTWRLQMPEDWRVTETGSRTRIVCPKGSHVTISTSVITGGGSPADLAKVVQRVEQNALGAAKEAARHFNAPLDSIVTTNLPSAQVTVHELRGHPSQGFLDFYILVGKRAVVLVTHEGDESGKTDMNRFREMLYAIRWHE